MPLATWHMNKYVAIQLLAGCLKEYKNTTQKRQQRQKKQKLLVFFHGALITFFHSFSLGGSDKQELWRLSHMLSWIFRVALKRVKNAKPNSKSYGLTKRTNNAWNRTLIPNVQTIMTMMTANAAAVTVQCLQLS